MPVSTHHQDYTAALARWRMVRDAVKGQEAIKAGTTLYLPKPNPTDTSEANAKRYEQYLERAMFLEVTGRTKNGLVGAIFRKDPSWKLPPDIEYMAEDANGSGQSLSQLGKRAAGEALEVGRIGLLTDYPVTDPVLNRADALARNLRPLILTYEAESIVNWDYGKVEGKTALRMVVLREQENVSDDRFKPDYETRYRLLELDENGNYYQQLFDEKDQPVTEPIYPKRGDGQFWRSLPFQLVGAEDNQEEIDDAPLYGLAVVNIGHYRNSADYEEGVFMHGQGTLFIDVGNMTQDDFTKANPNGILVGSRAGHVLGQGGKAQLLQMLANSAAKEAMDAKEQQMIAIGARLITAQGSNQTAEEARINASGESSVLSNLTGNVSEAIEASLEYAAIFAGANPEEVEFRMNQEFFEGKYDPQEAMARMQELDRGLVARSDYRHWLRKNGAIAAHRTDEMIDEEVGGSGTMPDLDAA